VAEYRDKLRLDSPVVLSTEERDLVVSGDHPSVGLFVHSVTDEPHLRLLAPVAKGAILGQFATIVVPEAFSKFGRLTRGDENLATFRHHVFALVEEFQSLLIPAEFGCGGEGVLVFCVVGSFSLFPLTAPAPVAEVEVPPAPLTLAIKDNREVTCCCNICSHREDEVFSNPQLLSDHVDSIMGALPVSGEKEGPLCPWGKCGGSFSTRQSLKNHLKSVHCNLV
jgi:hypothetical protein